MKTLSYGRNQKHRGQENRDAYELVTCLPGFCTLFGNLRSFFIQAKKLLVLGVVVLRHEDRARRRLRVVERLGIQPGCESRSVLVAKAPFEELSRLVLTIKFGGKPTVEDVAVVDPLLSCQGGKAFSSDSKPSRFGVLLCTVSSPLSCLVPTPRGGHGNEGEYYRFDNFNRFKTGLRRKDVVAHLI